MPLVWLDGGDYITSSVWPASPTPYTNIQGAGATIIVTPLAARTGLNGYRSNGQLARMNLSKGYNRLIYGQAVKWPATGAGTYVLQFLNNGTVINSLRFNTDGTIGVDVPNQTNLGPSAPVWQANQYHYVEMDVTCGIAPSGAVQVYVDGQSVLNLSGVTTTHALTTINQFQFGSSDNNFKPIVDIDDIYLLDPTGETSPYDTHLGDVEVSAFVPTAPGAYTQFTPVGSSQNWQNVNGIPASGSTYNQAAASGSRDSYVYGISNPAGAGVILGVMPMALMETDGAGSRTVELSATQAGVDAFSPSATSLGVGYIYIPGLGWWIMQKDVNGGVWTPTNLNPTEFGVELIS